MRYTVSPGTLADRDAACRMLSASRPGPLQDSAAARYRDLLSSGEFDPAGLFVARDERGVPRGAMLVQALPGAMGLAWPPRAERGSDRTAIEDVLFTAASRWLQSRGVKVCQAFGSEADREELTSLERRGFRCITQVTHRRLSIDRGREEVVFDPAKSPLRFDRFDALGFPPAAATVLATYEGSRDCPELNGSRTAEELLAGLTEPVVVVPEWRFLACFSGEPVGIVLVSAATEPGALDLNYLGLIPSARGRGWGEWLARFAVRVAIEERCHALALSVDIRNEPALRVYDRLGFREVDRRDVYLASWVDCS